MHHCVIVIVRGVRTIFRVLKYFSALCSQVMEWTGLNDYETGISLSQFADMDRL